ncbi:MULTISPECIES: hypothetical protein [Brucella/Ochrobactrum group]|uniref:CopL family metal-binding regulatory protein n=1 Tax=Ochrobactrum chromiisoli TaxID=2993941 RepID=A0ABT3QTN4_9HYPH|nr:MULTISPECIES: hypothetical protein [Brucella/Ochrobactrum group]MCX2698924.1 hypothetical protein [Ochrobactrum chromiisoli]
MTSAYLSGMFSRLVTMLAVLAIAVMTTVTSAHAARLSAEPDHSMHVGEMMQVAAGSEHSCDGEQHCGSIDTGSCELLCAGLSVFLTSPSDSSGSDYAPASHDLPTGAVLAGRAPGLNERPPKHRLL